MTPEQYKKFKEMSFQETITHFLKLKLAGTITKDQYDKAIAVKKKLQPKTAETIVARNDKELVEAVQYLFTLPKKQS